MSEWRHYDRQKAGGDIDWPSVDRHAKPARRIAQPKPSGPTTYHHVECVTTLSSGRVCGAVTIEATRASEKVPHGPCRVCASYAVIVRVATADETAVAKRAAANEG